MSSSAKLVPEDVAVEGSRKLTAVELVGGILCHICQQTYGNKKEFDVHYVNAHNSQPADVKYTCVVCRQFTAGYASFRGHCYNVHLSSFKCQTCNKSFKRGAALNIHINTMHVFKCKTPNCNKEFPTKKQLHMHQFIHKTKANQPPYPCQNCNSEIDSLDVCEQHIEDHSSFIYNCPICNLTGTKESISKHLVTHFGSDYQEAMTENNTDADNIDSDDTITDNSSINTVGGIQCQICNEILKNRLEFDTHFAANHPDSDIVYMCILCKKKYEKYSQFGCHLYEHMWKNKFKCDLCERFFPRLSLLVQHTEAFHPLPSGQAAATSGQPLACPRCARSFTTQRHRLAHMKAAHDERMLPCDNDNCDSLFESPKELIMHQKLHKSQDTWCRQCGLKFHSAASAEKHLDIHRTKQYQCPVCACNYAEKYLILNHISDHFESLFHMCKVCAKVFNAKKRLIEHIKTHASTKTFSCKHCGKGFSRSNHLKQHLAVHTGEKPYRCNVCEKTFATYPNFHKHMRKMHNIDTKTIKNSLAQAMANENAKPPQPDTSNQITMNLNQNYEFVDTDDSTMDSDSIDSIVIQKDAEIFENNITTDEKAIAELLMLAHNNDSGSEGDLLPLLPVAPTGAVIPREYGPDFVNGAPEPAGDVIPLDDHLLPHIDPLLTIKPAPPALPAPHDFYQPYYPEEIIDATKYETPVFTKICRNFYGEIDDLSRLPVMNTDIF